jgi:hypothetical protein
LGGVAFVLPKRFPDSDIQKIDFTAPFATYPARVRKYFEAAITISLAGREAELVRPERPLGFVREPELEPDELAAVIEAAAALTPREEERIAAGDDEKLDPSKSDEALALDDALKIVGLGRAVPFVAWLRAETYGFVRNYSFQKRLHPLAASLAEHTDLGVQDVRRILGDK